MQPIERYGLISFLFIVVSALAVYLWDTDGGPQTPANPGDQVARADASGGATTGANPENTAAAKRARAEAEARAAKAAADKRLREEHKRKELAKSNTQLPVGGVANRTGTAPSTTKAPRLQGGLDGQMASQTPSPTLQGGEAKTGDAEEVPLNSEDVINEVTTYSGNDLRNNRDKNRQGGANQTSRNGQVADAGTGALSGPVKPNAGGAAKQARGAGSAGVSNGTAGSVGYKLWKVSAGESYSLISQKAYGTSKHWKKIRDLNPGTSERRLQLNQEIKIPVLDQESANMNSPVAQTQSAATSKKRALADDEVRVSAGDTLSEIALAHLGKASLWKEIADINPKANPNSLKVGMVLKLPKAKARRESESVTVAQTNAGATNSASKFGRVR